MKKMFVSVMFVAVMIFMLSFGTTAVKAQDRDYFDWEAMNQAYQAAQSSYDEGMKLIQEGDRMMKQGQEMKMRGERICADCEKIMKAIDQAKAKAKKQGK